MISPLLRPPRECPYCGAQIHFKMNPIPHPQFVGDQGGAYEEHSCEKKEALTESLFCRIIKKLKGDGGL